MKLFNVDIKTEVINSLVMLIVFIIILFIIKAFINKIIEKSNKKSKHEQRRKAMLLKMFYKIIKYLMIVLLVLCIMSIFHINTTALVTSVGAIGLVVGLAFQDLLKDFLVGIAIVFEDQFSVGDFVLINGHKGDVVNFTLKSTRIKSLTGETTIISNREITEVTNYSLNKTILFLEIPVSYEDNNDTVEKILNDICDSLKEEIDEIDNIKLCEGIDELSSSSINYKLQLVTSIRNIHYTKRITYRRIKEVFDKNNIKIPYQQIEVHDGKKI